MCKISNIDIIDDKTYKNLLDCLIDYLLVNDLLIDCANKISIERQIIGSNFKKKFVNNKNIYIYTEIKKYYFDQKCIKVIGKNIESEYENIFGVEKINFDNTINKYLYIKNNKLSQKIDVEIILKNVFMDSKDLTKFICNYYNIDYINVLDSKEENQIKSELKKLYFLKQQIENQINSLELSLKEAQKTKKK